MAQTLINHCIDFLKQFQSDATHYKNFRVEEAERSDDGRYWLLTLGFDQPKIYTNPTELTQLLTRLELNERNYKVFKIDALDGKVLSMKMKEYVH